MKDWIERAKEQERREEEEFEQLAEEDQREIEEAGRRLGKRMQSSVGGDVVEERGSSAERATSQS